MSDINIIPIFDQSAPSVWHSFAHIRAVASYPDHDIDSLADKENTLVNKMSTDWQNKRGCKYAFGAYDGDDMVGFILGYAAARYGCVDSLFVLPQYHGNRTGTRLLSWAETALSLVATSVELISLANAMRR